MGIKEDYLTISEAAKEIGVTRQTISRWLKRGELHAEKIGREKVIHRKELSLVYGNQKFMELIVDKLFPRMKERIRKEFNYGRQDTIDTIFYTTKRDYFTFIVSRKDGNLDKVKLYTKYEAGKGLRAFNITREQYIKIEEKESK